MVCALFVVAASLGSCKSKKSAYRKAYEEAKQREIAKEDVKQPVVYEVPASTPVSTPVEDVVVSKPTPPAVIRKERVSAVDGETAEHLKRFSVVIGSFQNATNAKALRERMTEQGYNAVLAKNEIGMLRVIVSSYPTKEEAVAGREAVKARFAPDYKDAWILENE